MKSKYAHKIGIGITTHNRPEVFQNTFLQMRLHMPTGAKMVVVDDASDRPASENPRIGVQSKSNVTFYRFEKNVGIATAKNKCLELLDDCEHIFLFDDDTYPKKKDWFVPYIESGHVHMMYLFRDFIKRKLHDAVLVYSDDKITALSHARGCMLYVHNSVLSAVGGMDTEYKRWGYEHVDWSNRIYNVGLTAFRFMDVANSKELIYSGDEHEAVTTTVLHDERIKYIREMKPKYEASFTSTKYCRYKSNSFKREDMDPPQVILTTYLNALPDPQRKSVWTSKKSKLAPLIESVAKHDIGVVVLNNCFDEPLQRNVKFERISQTLNPYIQRWLSYWEYLNKHPEIRFAFCVDATDVKMLNFPFDSMDRNKLYIGSEDARLNHPWVLNTVHGSQLSKFILGNRKLKLLNCGLVGGSRELLMKLCRDIYENYLTINSKEVTDMPILNFLCYTKYKDIIEFGSHINTVFKANEEVSNAWFKHK